MVSHANVTINIPSLRDSIHKLNLHERRIQNLRLRSAHSAVAIRAVDASESTARNKRREAARDDPILAQKRAIQRAQTVVETDWFANLRLKKHLRQPLTVVEVRIH